uniref:DUF2382 domain-containing protein n=1 Tax=Steinernema glaseri TaxID=37863 RepID=A0A1I7Y8M6_9BILA
VSIGTHITLELPIVILATPLSGPSIEYRPFVAGAQPFNDSDEADKKRLSDVDFSFAPRYPVLLAKAPVATVVNGVPQTPCNTAANGGTPATNDAGVEVAAGALKEALMHASEQKAETEEEEDAHRMAEMKEELERLADEVKDEIQKVQKEAEEEVAKAAKSAKEKAEREPQISEVLQKAEEILEESLEVPEEPKEVEESLEVTLEEPKEEEALAEKVLEERSEETLVNGDVVVHRQVEVKKTEDEDGETVTTTTTTEIRHETRVLSGDQ